MHFDDLLFTYLGEFGRYQKLQFFLVCLPCVIVSLQVLSWTFTGAVVKQRCLFPGEDPTGSYYYPSQAFNISEDEVACSLAPAGLNQTNAAFCEHGYKWDTSEITNTALTRWDVACNRKWIRPLVQSMYYVGQLIGSIVFGYVGDRHGRKIVFIFAIGLLGVSGTAMAFVPAWEAFAFLRILAGISHPGIFVVAVVLGMELVGPSMRSLGGIVTGLFFAVGQILLGGLAYAIRDYQILQLVISVPAFLFAVYWWIIPESARWLVSQKRYLEADKILRRAARINKRELPAAWWEQLDVDTQKPLEADGSDKKYTYFDLFRSPQIRKRTLIAWIVWPTVSMIYYGIGMNPSFSGGDRYSTFILSGLAEVPGILLGSVLINRIGRKLLQVIGLSVPTVLLFTIAFIPSTMTGLMVFCVITSKALITMTYATIYVFTPELFPTVLRNQAMGSCSMIARLGAIGASYLIMWLLLVGRHMEAIDRWRVLLPHTNADINRMAVLMIFAAFGFVSAVLTLLLPETTGLRLPESVVEAENFGRGQGLFNFRPQSDAKLAKDQVKDATAIAESALGEENTTMLASSEKPALTVNAESDDTDKV